MWSNTHTHKLYFLILGHIINRRIDSNKCALCLQLNFAINKIKHLIPINAHQAIPQFNFCCKENIFVNLKKISFQKKYILAKHQYYKTQHVYIGSKQLNEYTYHCIRWTPTHMQCGLYTYPAQQSLHSSNMVEYFHWYNFTVHTMVHEHVETEQSRGGNHSTL